MYPIWKVVFTVWFSSTTLCMSSGRQPCQDVLRYDRPCRPTCDVSELSVTPTI